MPASGSKKTLDLNIGYYNKLSKGYPDFRLDLPKYFHRLGLRRPRHINLGCSGEHRLVVLSGVIQY